MSTDMRLGVIGVSINSTRTAKLGIVRVNGMLLLIVRQVGLYM